MKTYAFGWIAAFFLVGMGMLQAQVVTTKVCKGETVCNVLDPHRGFIYWEQSPDGIHWQLVPFMSADTMCITVDTSGYYRAQIQEGSCATVYSQVRHIVAVVIDVDAGADGSFCANNVLAIGGSPTASNGVGAYTYSWSPSAGLNVTNLPNPNANPSVTTTYVVTVMDSLGCVGMDSVTVTSGAAVIANAGPDQLVCFPNSAVLGGSPAGSGGTGILTYLWTPATDLSSTTVANPTVTPTGGAINYLLTVTDALGCLDTDTVFVDTTNGVLHGSMTFAFTGGVQTFVVPPCVDSITMDVYGAQGGANWVNNVNFGGRVTAKIAVVTGETLTVYVGGQPTSGVVPGYNGGGSGDGAGKGGGGASDVRRGAATLNDRIVVGGGAGGAGYWSSLHVVGGLGGGLIGGDGYRDPSYAANPGGRGATQIAGGADGTCINFNVIAMAGSFGQGGTPLGFNCGCEGYGGGGGWYGGAGSGNCRAGGGGSSYTIPAATHVVHQQGVRAGNGQVLFTW